MTTKQKTEMYARIQKHGENLKTLFRLPEGADPVKLCKQLRRIEHTAHRAAEAYCNGEIDGDQWQEFETITLKKVDKLLNFTASGVPVFVNGDPRGYALKIKDGYVHNNDVKIYHDMGGYGILAPDLAN